MAHIVVAPDSFKGSIDAAPAAAAIAQGWLSVRPGDTVTTIPQADGGEGTLAAIEAASTDAVVRGPVDVCGPDGRPVRASWLELPDGTAVVELASTSGLPLMDSLDAVGASTRGLGELLDRVLDTFPARLVIGLGGSATTDGAAGAFDALGLVTRGLSDGAELLKPHAGQQNGSGPAGGEDRARERLADQDWRDELTGVSLRHLRKPPPAGVELLTDVRAPLLGPQGAAAVFAPQKGADQPQVALLEQRLTRWVAALEAAGAPPVAEQPGAGAAGGAGYGFMALWGAVASPGAARIASLTGLDDAIHQAQVLITGEGQFDTTSLTGKVVGHALDLARAARIPSIVIAGALAANPSFIADPGSAGQNTQGGGIVSHTISGVSLTELAGSSDAALAQPRRWLVKAGATAAQRFGSR